MPPMLRVVSAFAGVGGFDLAFERAGATIVAQIEKDPACQEVLRRHWPDIPLFGDITLVKGEDLPEFDVLVGGFPCQDLSVAGSRAGLQGERSGLFFEFARLVEETQPAWWVLENVPGLLSAGCKPPCEGGCVKKHGGALGAVLGKMGELGYWWAYRSLDAQFFGVPQRRRRIFIVGHSRNRSCPREVLFESEGSDGDSPKGRAPGEGITGSLTGSPASSSCGNPDDNRAQAGFLQPVVGALQAHTDSSGYRLGADEVAAGHVIPVGSNGEAPTLARCVTTGTGKRYDPETETLVAGAYSVYPESGQGADLCATDIDTVPTLGAETLAKQAERGVHIVQARSVAVRGRDGGSQAEVGEEGVANALRAGDGGSSRSQLIMVESKKAQPKLHIVPLHLAQANEYVEANHRHHKKTLSHKFSIGVATEDGTLVGVAIVGRPVARNYDDGLTLEVNRTCTDGTPNANSCLYGAAWRVAKEMGYHRLITYTQEGESGASLRGAGWRIVAVRDARGDWAHHSKKRIWENSRNGGMGGTARTLWEQSIHPADPYAGDEPYTFDWQAGGDGDTSFRGKSRIFPVRKPGRAGSLQANKTEAVVYRKATKAHHSEDWERWEEAQNADTIAGGQGTAAATAVVNKELAVRRLTPTECERLQGFPDGHTAGQVDSQRYRQLGNAVAVPVAEWIARRLIAVHEQPRRRRSFVAGGVRYLPK